jgi:hypothetical protein
MSTPVEIAKDYYEGWETKDRSKLKLYSGLEFRSPDADFHFAEDFLAACWQFAGVKMENKKFISQGNTVCVKYEITSASGTKKPYAEWLTIDEGEIKSIEVFYDGR